MEIYFGKGRTEYGPGVQIDLTGEEVATAIHMVSYVKKGAFMSIQAHLLFIKAKDITDGELKNKITKRTPMKDKPFLEKVYDQIRILKKEGKSSYKVVVLPEDVKNSITDLRKKGYKVTLMKMTGLRILSVTW